MDVRTAPLPEAVDCPLPQHPAFARALAALGVGVESVVLGRGKRTVGHAVMIRRGRFALVSRGPVWAPEADTADRRAALAALRGRCGRLAPLIVNAETPGRELPGAAFLPLLTGATVVEWDLTDGTAARRVALGQKWRNGLVRAEAAGWTVSRRPMPPDPGHWLLARDAERARTRGYRTWPPALIAALADRERDAAWILTAERRGRTAAGILVLRHGCAATYQTSWADAEGRAGGATALLLWEAANWLAATGATRLDLGTIDTEGAPGLARFKLGTGAAARRLGGTWAGLRLI